MVPGSQIDGCIRQPQEQRQGGFRLSIFRFRVLYIVRAPIKPGLTRLVKREGAARKSAASFASPGATVSFFWPSSGFPQLNELTPPLVLYPPLSRLSI